MILTSDISKIQTFPRVFLDSTKKSKKIKKINVPKDSLNIFGFWDFGISVIFVNMQVRHQVQTRTPFSLISRRLCLGYTLFAICCSALFEVCLVKLPTTDFVTQFWVDIWVSENSNSTGLYGAFCGWHITITGGGRSWGGWPDNNNHNNKNHINLYWQQH